MSLSGGDRIGPYVVEARLGAGGMGEVYRARDTRLDRTVALKILSPDLAGDAQFRERFTREARAVAALNHPHICTVYDTGETTVSGSSSRPVQFLAMEYVDGETLASRLSRGPLPAAEALPIAVQLARALAQAHRAGIVHRDLKPANVMLSKGSAKLLDFGLAKHAGAGSNDLTSAGVVLGTLQYMAPEQLAGQPADARTDIFALGAVLYEMLTGKRSFAGVPVAAAAGAATEPIATPLSGIQSPALDRTIRKCLAVDPDDRWQSAADLAAELQWIAEGSGRAESPAGAPPALYSRTRERLAWGLAALLGIVALVGAYNARSLPAADQTPKRFVVPLPGMLPTAHGIRTFAVMPDGSGVVYMSGDGTQWRFHVYTLADGVSRALAGTERGQFPTVSPDGKWIAFYRDQRVMKLALAGGPPQVLCIAPSIRGLAWGVPEWIAVGALAGISRVLAGGGDLETLTSIQPGELRHVLPHVLPGGKTILFTTINKSGTMADAATEAVDVATRQRRLVLKGGVDARYSASGHLLYARENDLMAVAFDPERLQMSGDPFLAAAAIRVTPQSFDAFFDLTHDGTLVSMASTASELQRTLVWIDRKGTETAIPVPVRAYFHPALLPDEQSLIVEIEETPHNLWHLDLATGALTRLTPEGANHRAIASADGRFIMYSSDRTVPRSLFRQPVDGSSEAKQVASGAGDLNVAAVSSDGRWLAFTATTTATKSDLWIVQLDGDQQAPRKLFGQPANEHAAAFSPDGRWIAYSTDESGRTQVVMTAFPGPGPRRQLSPDGGETPSFSPDGRKVYYRLGSQIFVVDITTDPVLGSGRPAVAFELPAMGAFAFTGLPNYVVTRKGERVLTVKYVGGESRPRDVQVTVNWFESLRRASADR
jgi:serine/threonine-protein kinase